MRRVGDVLLGECGKGGRLGGGGKVASGAASGGGYATRRKYWVVQ